MPGTATSLSRCQSVSPVNRPPLARPGMTSRSSSCEARGASRSSKERLTGVSSHINTTPWKPTPPLPRFTAASPRIPSRNAVSISSARGPGSKAFRTRTNPSARKRSTPARSTKGDAVASVTTSTSSSNAGRTEPVTVAHHAAESPSTFRRSFGDALAQRPDHQMTSEQTLTRPRRCSRSGRARHTAKNCRSVRVTFWRAEPLVIATHDGASCVLVVGE